MGRSQSAEQVDQLTADRFTLLNGMASSNRPLVVKRLGSRVELHTAPPSWIGLLVMGVVLFGVNAGFYYLLVLRGDASPAIVLPINCLSTLGPITVGVIHTRYVQGRNPYLQYDRLHGLIKTDAGERSYPIDDYVALASVTLPDDEGNQPTQLQLVLRGDSGLEHKLLLYCPQGETLTAFGRETGLRTIAVAPAGAGSRAPIELTEITPARSA